MNDDTPEHSGHEHQARTASRSHPEHTDESLAEQGVGYLDTEPEVAANDFNSSHGLVRAAFALRGRHRLHADEMHAALDEVNEREV